MAEPLQATTERTAVPAFDLVIFGANGDLAMRKLFVALAARDREGVLPPESRIIGVVRQKAQLKTLPETIAARLHESGFDKDEIKRFMGRIVVAETDATKLETYDALKHALGKAERVRAFYLSTPPDLFIPIVENLGKSGLAEGDARVIIEKPIGRDLTSARAINDALAKVFTEKRTYRIDHYLGKETVQNLMVMRFANTLFERSLSSRDVDHVQITAAETVGLESRAGYYDGVGALRDMIQNHVMQLLCLFAMEPPNTLDAEAVRDEKLRVLKALKPIAGGEVQRQTVRGQYSAGSIDGKPVRGYTEELGRASNTETFVALRCEIENWRWAGVPFYLRTGKRLAARYSEIDVTFKQVPFSIFRSADGHDPLQPDRLIIRLQPNEGVQFQMMMKVPGSGRLKLVPRMLDLRYAEAFNERTPDAYERLLTDVIRGDQTLFMSRHEVEAAWRFVDPILDAWRQASDVLPRYAAGSFGPSHAFGLIERDGRSWVDPDLPA